VELIYRLYLRSQGAGAAAQEIMLKFWLSNKGPATASSAFVLYHSETPSSQLRFDHRAWEETVTGKPGAALICKRTIHPEEIVPVFETSVGWSSAGSALEASLNNFRCTMSVSALNQSPIKFEVQLTSKDRDLDKKAIRIEN
jgi:hypothetical protein